MQRIIEFRKRKFFSSSVDIDELNQKIRDLNRDGWTVKSVAPCVGLGGAVTASTLLIENNK